MTLDALIPIFDIMNIKQHVSELTRVCIQQKILG